MPARLIQQLVTKGLLPTERGAEALRIQAMTGGALDTVLLELGWLQEQDILEAMGEASTYRPVNLADFEPNLEVAALIPPKIAERLCVAPLSTDGPALHVACGYPVKKAELDEVAFLLGKQLELWVGIEARIRDWIATLYRQPLAARFSALLVNIDPTRPVPSTQPVARSAAPELGPEPPTPVENVVPQQLDDEPPTPPRPPPPPLAPTAPPPAARASSTLVVEERTLEDALTAEMLDRLAQSVAEEPIPLDVKKAPLPPSGLPAEVVSFGRRPSRTALPAMQAPPSQQEDPTPYPHDFVLEEVPTDPGLPDAAPAAHASAGPTSSPQAPAHGAPAYGARPTHASPQRSAHATPASAAPTYGAREPAPAQAAPEQSPYNALASSPRGAPTTSTYGAPQAAPEQSPHAASAAAPRGAASTQSYGAPQAAPEQSPYAATPTASRSAPATSTYGAPQAAPEQPHAATTSSPRGAPMAQSYAPAAATHAAPEPPIPPRGSSSYLPPASAYIPPAAPATLPPIPPRGSSWYIPPSAAPEPPPPASAPTQESYAAWEAAAHQAQTSPPELQEPEPPPASPPVRLALPMEPAKPPPVDHSAPEWSLQDARAQLKEATVERDRIIEVALRYGRRTFDLVAAFAVIRGSAVGWDVRGEGMEATRISQVSIPLDSTSVFRTVALSRGSYVGPLPPDSLSKHFLEMFGRSPRTVFLFPVEVRSRLVAILYGDSGAKPLSQRKLSDYILFCQDLPGAFQELLVKRKQRAGALLLPEDGGPLLAGEAIPKAAAATTPSDAGAAVPKGLGWSPFASSTAGRLGRAASIPAPIASERDRPPPDFGPILRRLTGPDATERARAVAELARTPEASSRVLAQNFPGPTAWSRLPVMELPEPDELGPIPGALARLGRPAAQALAPLLDADDSDTRYFALLTAGNLPFPELVDGVLRGLFDLEPDISSAARAASTSLKRVARFEMAMKDLRQELTSIDAMRRSLAARALGVLHDREAIDGLINLTGSDDQMCASAAAEALRDVTKATFGTSPRQWTRWWAENRSRRRVEWLVAALRHPDMDIRINAIDELSRAVNDHLGFIPDAPETEREGAVRRWEALIHQGGRWQKWDL